MCKLIPFCKGAVALSGDDENTSPPNYQSNIWIKECLLFSIDHA